MYAALWRLLPGPRWVKALTAVALAAVVVACLFTWVFPAVAETLELFDTTVAGG
ncbi:hypothetical protein MF406_00980 [Georgenia sp. TF02-10]|uniref:hypothetical protein n=1 Tax=Georgenia sp. TF02-10 TaxID=2917725 RepID=UPI001FA6D3C8|nr:hypothetical protein [Georgenia sp. TF02-10]UNX54906.1 hypothetical protein MF406_00980 [Georgenia sp. TF02-10]